MKDNGGMSIGMRKDSPIQGLSLNTGVKNSRDTALGQLENNSIIQCKQKSKLSSVGCKRITHKSIKE